MPNLIKLCLFTAIVGGIALVYFEGWLPRNTEIEDSDYVNVYLMARDNSELKEFIIPLMKDGMISEQDLSDIRAKQDEVRWRLTQENRQEQKAKLLMELREPPKGKSK